MKKRITISLRIEIEKNPGTAYTLIIDTNKNTNTYIYHVRKTEIAQALVYFIQDKSEFFTNCITALFEKNKY